MTVIFFSRAIVARASVEAPGTLSARSNNAASSFWQKYCERNSSGKQTTSAPKAAACSTNETARSRFSAASLGAAIRTKPTVNVRTAGIPRELTQTLGEAPSFQDAGIEG